MAWLICGLIGLICCIVGLLCSIIGIICGPIGLLCGQFSLFCGLMGLVCGIIGLISLICCLIGLIFGLIILIFSLITVNCDHGIIYKFLNLLCFEHCDNNCLWQCTKFLSLLIFVVAVRTFSALMGYFIYRTFKKNLLDDLQVCTAVFLFMIM